MELNLQRIGGEARLVLIEDGGVVANAYFVTTAPVRGFERLVKGKNPLFIVEAVMRICGICHAAHGIAAAEAIEDAVGVTPPANGRVLREAIGLLNRVQSHLSHLALVIPDIAAASSIQGFILEAIRLVNSINDVLAKIGGAPTHPPYIAVGGVEKTPSQSVIRDSIAKIKRLLDEYTSFLDRLKGVLNTKLVDILRRKKLDVRPLATHLFYGDRYNISAEKISVLPTTKYRSGKVPEEVSRSTSLIALYGGRPVEAGPRARLMVYQGFSDKSIWGLQEARFIEIELCLRRIAELLEQVDPNEPSKTVGIVYRRGRGIGVYEAPRGTLVHTVELGEDGRASSYRIVVPTMFNIPLIEEAVKGLPIEVAEVVPRLYDPCIPCSTHVIKMRGGRR